MTVVLDVILATIASAIVILTIIFSVLNVQQMNYNTMQWLAITDYAMDSVEVLQDWLGRAGLHSTTEDDPFGPQIPTFNSDFNYTFGFYAKDDFWQTGRYWYEFGFQRIGTDNNVGRVMMVEQEYPMALTNIDTFTIDVYEVERPICTFYRADGTAFTPTPTNPISSTDGQNIRSAKIDMVFRAPGWGRGDDDLTIRFPVSFWVYFKNMYIRDLTTT